MSDAKNSRMFEEINRYFLLLFSECKTDAALRAQRRAQAAATDLENELKQTGK